MKNRTKIYSLGAIAVGLMLPHICFGNNGLKGLGAAFEMLFILLGVIAAISVTLMILNIRWKKTWIRIINVLAFMPQLLFIAGAFTFDESHVIGTLCLSFIALQIYLLYKSFSE